MVTQSAVKGTYPEFIGWVDENDDAEASEEESSAINDNPTTES